MYTLMRTFPYVHGHHSAVMLMFHLRHYFGQAKWLSGLAPPSAQGMILESWDRVPRQAPCMEPASPSACVYASLCVSLMNK